MENAETFLDSELEMGKNSKSMNPLYEEQWISIRSRLQGELGDAAFRSWLEPLTLWDVESGEAKIFAPTKFLSDWVSARYAGRIVQLWNEVNSDIFGVTIEVAADTEHSNRENNLIHEKTDNLATISSEGPARLANNLDPNTTSLDKIPAPTS